MFMREIKEAKQTIPYGESLLPPPLLFLTDIVHFEYTIYTSIHLLHAYTGNFDIVNCVSRCITRCELKIKIAFFV